MNGFEILKQIRKSSNIPVILLTARGDDVDRIVGLEIGADDYVPKPFNPRELAARVSAVLRRTGSGDRAAESGVMRVGDVELDPGARQVMRGGAEIDLTSVEFDILHALMQSAGKVVTREFLSNSVLGRRFDPFDRSIDMHVSKIRRKLDGTEGGEHIKTIRSVGYIFVQPGGHA
jgi:two-component system response regulator CpxR